MEFVIIDKKERIGTITLNRPEKRNALNEQVVRELQQAFDDCIADSTVKLLVLKAKGKVFCAGADLAYLQQLQENTYNQNLQDSLQLMRLFKTIYTCPKIVIAAVHGHAIAGGCGLATVCDFAFAVDEALFGYSETKIGFVPAIVAAFLLRKVGETIAKGLLLKGDLFSAAEALQIGLIHAVVSKDNLDNEVQRYAEEFCTQNSENSLALTKELIHSLPEMSLEDGLTFGATMNAKARETPDCKKGIASFLEKKELKW